MDRFKQKVFTVRFEDFGSDSHVSKLTVQVGSDPRLVVFRGDPFWQWHDGSSLRNHGKFCSWSQCLHDSLRGVGPLHSGDPLHVLPQHPDHAAVAQLVDDVDQGRKLPTNPTGDWR